MPPPPSPAVVRLRVSAVARATFETIGALVTLGVATGLWRLYGGASGWTVTLPSRYLELEGENTVPAWFSSVLLLACAGAAALAGGLERAARRHGAGEARRRGGWFWWVIAATFVYLSIDEASAIHEVFGTRIVSKAVGPTTGLLFYGWVLLGGLGALLFAAASVPFLWRLPRRTAGRFVLSGVLFVTGAVGLEMLGGRHAERAGNATVQYLLFYCAEEALEMLGAGLFFVSILRHVEAAHGPLEIRAGGGA